MVITRPDTPKPWINYLSNNVYHALVSQTGGGYSYYKDSKLHRILHWENHLSDRPGRYLFIKDQDSKTIWTPNWQPLCQPLEQWQALHGLGYTSLQSLENGVETNITYFVPPRDPCEIWLVKMKNRSDQHRSLTLYPYAHWLLGDYYLEQNYKNIMTLYNEGNYDEKNNAIIAFKHPSSARPYTSYGFFASSVKPRGYELSYKKFIGQYGSLSHPALLDHETCSNRSVRGEEMISLMQIPLTLRPQQEITLVFVLGFTEDKKQISKIIRRNILPEKASRLLEETKTYWRKKLDTVQVKTPDPKFDFMTNHWGQYQLLQITRWRSASYYVPGEGGRGFRDTAQDVEGVVSIDPKLALEWLKKLLSHQYASGHAVSGFSDIEGPWETGKDPKILGKSDMAVWIPTIISTYIQETGDTSLLKLKIPFLDQGQGTVWDHCRRAMDHLWKQRGRRGLPLFWKADWNDALDQCGLKGKGESVWLAMAYGKALLETEILATIAGNIPQARKMRKRYEKLRKIINQTAWDGDWYVRLFTDSGKTVGSKSCKEGKIYLNTQSWAILSGVAPELRAEKSLKAVAKYLETDFGPALFSPAYQSYDPHIGRITSFAPGTKENAAIFSHAAAFLVVALAMLKKGKQAYELFSKIAPTNPCKTEEIYQAEPYVYAEYCYGPAHDQFGQGAFSWNTGTASWMFMAATQWILGVRPTIRGLLMDPCVPPHWSVFSMKRSFRGAVYNIRFKNPNHVSSGVAEIRLNGKKMKGNLIPAMPKGGVYDVEVVMG